MTEYYKTAREELQEQIDELRKRLEALENDEWLAANRVYVSPDRVGELVFVESTDADGKKVMTTVAPEAHLEWREDLGRAVSVAGPAPKPTVPPYVPIEDVETKFFKDGKPVEMYKPKRGKRAKGGEGT